MIWALAIAYVWAGLTVLFALYMVEDIGIAINKLVPEKNHLRPFLKNHPWTMASIVALWWLSLPAWLVVAAYEAQGN